MVYLVAFEDGDDMVGGFNIAGIYDGLEDAEERADYLNKKYSIMPPVGVYEVPLDTPGYLTYWDEGFQA